MGQFRYNLLKQTWEKRGEKDPSKWWGGVELKTYNDGTGYFIWTNPDGKRMVEMYKGKVINPNILLNGQTYNGRGAVVATSQGIDLIGGHSSDNTYKYSTPASYMAGPTYFTGANGEITYYSTLSPREFLQELNKLAEKHFDSKTFANLKIKDDGIIGPKTMKLFNELRLIQENDTRDRLDLNLRLLHPSIVSKTYNWKTGKFTGGTWDGRSYRDPEIQAKIKKLMKDDGISNFDDAFTKWAKSEGYIVGGFRSGGRLKLIKRNIR